MIDLHEQDRRQKRQGRTSAPSSRTRLALWARGAGRCYICNKSLIGDLEAGNENSNFGFVAHIVADTPGGPRGDPVRSPALSDEIGNLILLCYPHHKLIDVIEVGDYPEERLLRIKAEHEARVAITSELTADRASHILRYSANIGQQRTLLPYDDVANAMLPRRYPAEGRATIDIHMRGSSYHDDESEYWRLEQENLHRQYSRKVGERVESQSIRHLSVFALAPQPLLIELGRLLGDIVPASVHQLHREPAGWRWCEDGDPMKLTLRSPESHDGPIALAIGISAEIAADRVHTALGRPGSIWRISVERPHNDILRCAKDLAALRVMMRRAYNQILAIHGSETRINVFPAMPVAAAVEVGRAWMPKVDPPLVVFDQNRRKGGFIKSLTIE